MKQLLASMSTAQKVGQLFLIRCPQENEAASVACFQPAGLVLFSVDFENRTAEECLARVNAMQEASLIPMVVSADEEGGTVCRVSRQPALRDRKFPSPRGFSKPTTETSRGRASFEEVPLKTPGNPGSRPQKKV